MPLEPGAPGMGEVESVGLVVDFGVVQLQQQEARQKGIRHEDTGKQGAPQPRASVALGRNERRGVEQHDQAR